MAGLRSTLSSKIGNEGRVDRIERKMKIVRGSLLALGLGLAAMKGATPGLCTLPDPDQQQLLNQTNQCRGKAVVVAAGAVYYVAIDNGDGRFLGQRFLVQFDRTVVNGKVRAYYVYLGGSSPAGQSLGTFINGKRVGRSMVELALGDYVVGTTVSISQRFVRIADGMEVEGGSYLDRTVGFSYKISQ
jgi:hypothetical protein